MGRMPNCGHNDGWMIRLMDKGVRYKYCWGCLIEATGIKPVDYRVPITKENAKEVEVKPAKKKV